MPVETVIKLRRGTAAQWTAANSVLAAGEMGVETDTDRSKFGDGTTAWTSLGYTVGDSSGVGTVEWTSVQNKPATFAPSAHDHVKANITDFAHTHVMADITDLAFPPTTIMSDTAPAGPVEATRWINTTNFIEYVYYDSYWVEV
jgi:hypothetical protein|tara:strand:- start:1240 stop:1671 length:432 start_codon:yes stop_codon:yes gene_type:complete